MKKIVGRCHWWQRANTYNLSTLAAQEMAEELYCSWSFTGVI